MGTDNDRKATRAHYPLRSQLKWYKEAEKMKAYLVLLVTLIVVLAGTSSLPLEQDNVEDFPFGHCTSCPGDILAFLPKCLMDLFRDQSLAECLSEAGDIPLDCLACILNSASEN